MVIPIKIKEGSWKSPFGPPLETEIYNLYNCCSDL